MTVRIARGAKTQWRRGRLVFRIESTASFDTLAAAVERISSQLLEIGDEDDPGPKYVSAPVPLPDGLIIRMDSPDASAKIISQVIELMVTGLETAGIDVRVSGPQDLPDSPIAPRVVLTAVPSVPSAADQVVGIENWQVEQAVRWVLAAETRSIWASSAGVAVPLPAAAAVALLWQWLNAGRNAELVADSDGDRRQIVVAHPAACSSYELPRLELSHCGSSVGRDLTAAFDELTAEGRTLARGSSWVFTTAYDHPRSHYGVQPAYEGEPRARECLAALRDSILDAAPWQVLTSAQAQRLPRPLPPEARFDGETGELWLGAIDDWRFDLEGPRGGFRRSKRDALGSLILTQDRAWEALQIQAGDHKMVGYRPDLSTVPIVGRPSPHPSLGLTPLQLVTVARAESYSDDPRSLPQPLKQWLRELAEFLLVADKTRLRSVASRIAASDINSDDGPRVRRTLTDWLVCTLTPDLLDVVSDTAGDVFRAIDPITEIPRSLDAVQSAIEALRPLAEALLRSLPRSGPPSPPLDAIRAVGYVAMITQRAATEFDWANNYQANRGIEAALEPFFRSPGRDDPDLAQRIWSGATVELYERAFSASLSVAQWSQRPRPTNWDRSMRQIDWHTGRASANAAARALMEETDPSRAWEVAFAAAQAAAPAQWSAALADLDRDLGGATLAAAWSAAQRHMADLHPQAKLSADLVVVAVPAAVACSLSASVATDDAQRAELTHRLWREVDLLVTRLCDEA